MDSPFRGSNRRYLDRLRFVDLRSRPEHVRDSDARRLIATEVKTRFDLTVGPIMRPMLLQLTEDNYILAIVMHHIAMDGWSLTLLIHELAAFYTAFAEGRDTECAGPHCAIRRLCTLATAYNDR